MSLARLPGAPRPEQLPQGTLVEVTHPENPTEFTSGSPGRRCEVLHTSWHHPAPTKARPVPGPPRLFVTVRVLTRPSFERQGFTSYWADELSLVVK